MWLGCLLMMVPLVLAAGKMWVGSGRAKLKTDKKTSAKTVAVLPVGTEVIVLDSARRWYQVRTPSGKEGWIYRGKLTKSPPEPEVQSESEDFFAAFSGSDIQADEADTARSIRGLSEETEAYANRRRTPKVYRKALDGVLAMSITAAELDAFLSQGKIGEYAP
jgi:hypothetical protein